MASTVLYVFLGLLVSAALADFGGYGHHDDDDDEYSLGERCLTGSSCDKCPADMKKTFTTKFSEFGFRFQSTRTFCCSGFASLPDVNQTETKGKRGRESSEQFTKCYCPFTDTCARGAACSGCPVTAVTKIDSRLYCCNNCAVSSVNITRSRVGDRCECNAVTASSITPSLTSSVTSSVNVSDAFTSVAGSTVAATTSVAVNEVTDESTDDSANNTSTVPTITRAAP